MAARNHTWLAALCVVIALGAGVTAAIGVFARGSGATEHATSIRGEEFEYATDGVYAYNAERVVAEGVGWDALTLFVAVPVLLIASPFVARGSLRGRLLAAGILGYLVYQYLMYAVFWALGPLFPAFIVLYPLSFIALLWIVTTIDLYSLPARFSESFPRRSMAIFSGVMGLQLVAMWVPRIATGLSGDLAGAGLMGTPTLAVQALDLGIIVPLAFATAVFAWQRKPVGYLLAAVFSVKGVTMSGAIVAMLVSAWIVEGKLDAAPFALFSAATLIAGTIAVLVMRSVREDTVSTRAVA
ncbi:MAG: hypothetical protein JXP37_00395 [Coriobacteriia bacterium]|nr:hypothetical protein [Coriobacteriia bacterium]